MLKDRFVVTNESSGGQRLIHNPNEAQFWANLPGYIVSQNVHDGRSYRLRDYLPFQQWEQRNKPLGWMM